MSDIRLAAERLGTYCDGLMPDTSGPEGQDGYRLGGQYFADVCKVVRDWLADHTGDWYVVDSDNGDKLRGPFPSSLVAGAVRAEMENNDKLWGRNLDIDHRPAKPA